jgi:hypothetical protein
VETVSTTISARDARVGAGALLGIALVWPSLPVHPPLACPLRTLTGIPCPLCGATRAVVALAHGDVFQSLRFNPVGIVVVLVAIALIAGLRVERLRVAPWIVISLAALLWTWNIGFNPTFR